MPVILACNCVNAIIVAYFVFALYEERFRVFKNSELEKVWHTKVAWGMTDKQMYDNTLDTEKICFEK